MVRINKIIDFNNPFVSNILQINLHSEPTDDDHAATKSYVDYLSENDRNRRDMSTVFIDQHNEFGNNKFTNLDSITFKRNRLLNEELSNKKYVDNELDKDTFLRFNQTLQNYLKVSVGNDVGYIAKYDRKQIFDATIFFTGNAEGHLLPSLKIECIDRNNAEKTTSFLTTVKSISPTPITGSSSIPPVGDSFI